MAAKNFFSLDQKKRIVEAIEQAELSTSGEIRLHLDEKCRGNVMDRAAYVFETLEMHKTDLRNGVLFYLAVEDKKFAILGDAGINQKVPAFFWDEIKDEMITSFKKCQFEEALCKGIIKAGEQLKSHFPYQANDINELDNEISFGSNES